MIDSQRVAMLSVQMCNANRLPLEQSVTCVTLSADSYYVLSSTLRVAPYDWSSFTGITKDRVAVVVSMGP